MENLRPCQLRADVTVASLLRSVQDWLQHMVEGRCDRESLLADLEVRLLPRMERWPRRRNGSRTWCTTRCVAGRARSS
jgi:hypothetical protein